MKIVAPINILYSLPLDGGGFDVRSAIKEITKGNGVDSSIDIKTKNPTFDHDRVKTAPNYPDFFANYGRQNP